MDGDELAQINALTPTAIFGTHHYFPLGFFYFYHIRARSQTKASRWRRHRHRQPQIKTPAKLPKDAHSQTLPDGDPYPALLELLFERLPGATVSLPQCRSPCTRSYPWTAGRGSSAGQTAKEMRFGDIGGRFPVGLNWL